MAFELTLKYVNRLSRTLKDLLEQSEADACLICDHAGHVLAQENLVNHDPLLISALGAGIFAATRELACILGENEFSSVIHQGEKRSILISACDDDVLLVVMFSGDARIGLVKLYTPTATAEIKNIIHDASIHATSVESVDRNFVLEDEGNLFG